MPLSEAKANLNRYGQLYREPPMIVTVNCKPSFQFVPLEENDDLIDRLIEKSACGRGIASRRRG
jgi:hypothetical protein